MTQGMTGARDARAAAALEQVLGRLVAEGELPGASAAIVSCERATVVTVGFADLAGEVPLRAEAIFRLASISKPIVAALALTLVQDGVLAPEDPIARWIPELASPVVLRSVRGPVGEVVPAARPVLVRHVLDSTCGWGFPGDLSLTGVAPMFEAVGDGRDRHALDPPDAWVAALAKAPLLFQPGERWLYDTSYDLLGVLLARAAGRPLPALLQERLLGPLGMAHTGFSVDPADRALLVEGVRREDGGLRVQRRSDVCVPPRFPSGAGGLAGTIGDVARFARMLACGGTLDGTRVLTGASVEAMTSDQLTAEQREEGGGFLSGQSWGYGGTVDVAITEPWHAPGRYGWIGVTGTSLFVRPDAGTGLVILTQRELGSGEDMKVLQAIWEAVATAG